MNIINMFFSKKINDRAQEIVDEELENKVKEMMIVELGRVRTYPERHFRLYDDGRRDVNFNKIIDEALRIEFERQITQKEIGKIIKAHVKNTTSNSVSSYLRENLDKEIGKITSGKDFIKGLVEEVNKYQLN